MTCCLRRSVALKPNASVCYAWMYGKLYGQVVGFKTFNVTNSFDILYLPNPLSKWFLGNLNSFNEKSKWSTFPRMLNHWISPNIKNLISHPLLARIWYLPSTYSFQSDFCKQNPIQYINASSDRYDNIPKNIGWHYLSTLSNGISAHALHAVIDALNRPIPQCISLISHICTILYSKYDHTDTTFFCLGAQWDVK